MKNLSDFNFNFNETLLAEIEHAVKMKKIPHAILISGADYETRVAFAQYLSAASLCCDDRSPCGNCKDCRKIFSEIHPDVQFFQREKDKKEFSVRIVREKIKPEAYVKPNEAKGRIFVINDAETMNASAQNALLKILEEPPRGVKFILCCDVAASMLETIRSRSTLYSLSGRETVDNEDDRGIQAISVELANALISTNEYDFMSRTAVFEKDKEALIKVVEKMQVLFRDALAVKNNSQIISGERDCIYKLASSLSTLSLLNLIKKCDEIVESINKNANLNLLITRFTSSFRQITRG